MEGFSLNKDNQLLSDLRKDASSVYQHLFLLLIGTDKKYLMNLEKQRYSTKTFNRNPASSFLFKGSGFKAMFNHLQIDRIHWRKDRLVIIKPFDKDIQLKDSDSIMLLPSYFIWPHLFVESFNQGIAVTYDITEQPSYYNATPENLITIFKALSDPVRLQIMNYVIDKPSTTQSLAQILVMSNSSVSRHLQILKEANLLTTTKAKNSFFMSQHSSLHNLCQISTIFLKIEVLVVKKW